jgi:DNA-binding NarL/FixJ family response regulator
MKPSRVLVADDHTLLAEAIRKLLEPAYDVVGTVGDGQALLDAAPVLKPDVILIDVAMPRLNGLEAGRRLKQIMPWVKLIFLTMNEDPDLAVEAMRHGASGYLLKTSVSSELFHAIQAALKGKLYVTPQIARGMQYAFNWDPKGKNPDKELTARQREVIQLLAEGKSMKEAADILKVSPRTIAFHKYSMMKELGIKTNAELIRVAIKKHHLVAQPCR